MMRALAAKVAEHRNLRNAARDNFDRRLGQIRQDLEARSIAGRIADKASEEARDAIDEAIAVAAESKGVIAGTIAALAIWFFRNPILARLEEMLDAEADYKGSDTMTENDNQPANKANKSKSNVVSLNQSQNDPPHRKVARFVQDHPVMTIAGGLAVGVLAAALIPRGNRAFLARRTSQWADTVGAAAAALARQALERAEATSSQVRNRADALAERAGGFGQAARDRLGRLRLESGSENGIATRILRALQR